MTQLVITTLRSTVISSLISCLYVIIPQVSHHSCLFCVFLTGERYIYNVPLSLRYYLWHTRRVQRWNYPWLIPTLFRSTREMLSFFCMFLLWIGVYVKPCSSPVSSFLPRSLFYIHFMSGNTSGYSSPNVRIPTFSRTNFFFFFLF